MVCMMRDTATRVEWGTGSGVVLMFIIFTSAGMMWAPVGCGGGRGDCELAGSQALKGTNVRDLGSWLGDERGLGAEHDGGRAIVVIVFTSL